MHPAIPFWEDAYREHGPAVLAFLRRRAPRRDDAEDLLQETFVRAIRAESGIEQLPKVRSYLFTTAQNLLINHLQRDRRKLSDVELRTIREETEGKMTSGPEAALQAKEFESRVREVTERMPKAERIAFHSAVLESLSYDDVAKANGWTRDQVKVYVYRARKRMLRELADFEVEDSKRTNS